MMIASEIRVRHIKYVYSMSCEVNICEACEVIWDFLPILVCWKSLLTSSSIDFYTVNVTLIVLLAEIEFLKSDSASRHNTSQKCEIKL